MNLPIAWGPSIKRTHGHERKGKRSSNHETADHLGTSSVGVERNPTTTEDKATQQPVMADRLGTSPTCSAFPRKVQRPTAEPEGPAVPVTKAKSDLQQPSRVRSRNPSPFVRVRRTDPYMGILKIVLRMPSSIVRHVRAELMHFFCGGALNPRSGLFIKFS